MEAIGCLVPELQSEMRSRCGTQLLKKTQYFYTATVNSMSSYTIVLRKFTRVLVQQQLASRQRQLGKTVGKDSGCESGAYIVSIWTER